MKRLFKAHKIAQYECKLYRKELNSNTKRIIWDIICPIVYLICLIVKLL